MAKQILFGITPTTPEEFSTYLNSISRLAIYEPTAGDKIADPTMYKLYLDKLLSDHSVANAAKVTLSLIPYTFLDQLVYKMDKRKIITFFQMFKPYLVKGGLGKKEVVKQIRGTIDGNPKYEYITKSYVIQWVNGMWRSENVWDMVRREIKNNPYRFTFQQPCMTPDNVSEVKAIAESINLRTDGKSKRDICTSLTDFIEKRPECNLDETDPYSMDTMNEIPPYRRYKIGNQCFDLFSLVSSIQSGSTTNPFTRDKLPVDDIMERYNNVTKLVISKSSLVEDVRNSSILSLEGMQKQKFTHVLTKMRYPISMDSFFRADESIMDKIFNDFINFQIIPISNQEKIAYETSDNKHYAIIDIMYRIANHTDNENTPTIIQAMEIALNDNVPNINVRRGRVDDDDERNVRQRIGGKYGRSRRSTRKKSRSKRITRKKSTISTRKKSKRSTRKK